MATSGTNVTRIYIVMTGWGGGALCNHLSASSGANAVGMKVIEPLVESTKSVTFHYSDTRFIVLGKNGRLQYNKCTSKRIILN